MQGEEFAVGLAVPNYPSLEDLSLCCSWKLSYILQGFEKDLQDCVATCHSLLDYLNTFHHIVETRMEAPAAVSLLRSGVRPSLEVYERVFGELEDVGWDNVLELSNSLDVVRLRAEDDAGREHCLSLKRELGDDLYSAVADLPAQVLQTLEQSASLLEMYRMFLDRLASLQAFWDTMDRLGEECWVLDPDVPGRSHVHRRIAIGSNVSLQITVDPSNVHLRPDMKFLGSEQAIRPFRDSVTDMFEDWYPRGGLVSNLLDALGLTQFPPRPVDGEDTLQLVRPGECCVCYEGRTDDGRLPSEACDDPRCGSNFHQTCLFEWLSALPKHTVSFNRMYGTCPNCDQAISCEIPET